MGVHRTAAVASAKASFESKKRGPSDDTTSKSAKKPKGLKVPARPSAAAKQCFFKAARKCLTPAAADFFRDCGLSCVPPSVIAQVSDHEPRAAFDRDIGASAGTSVVVRTKVATGSYRWRHASVGDPSFEVKTGDQIAFAFASKEGDTPYWVRGRAITQPKKIDVLAFGWDHSCASDDETVNLVPVEFEDGDSYHVNLSVGNHETRLSTAAMADEPPARISGGLKATLRTKVL